MLWTCPRCSERVEAGRTFCSACGSGRVIDPLALAPPPPLRSRCPGCGGEIGAPPVLGRLTCPSCAREFEDHAEWVRRCRATAYAAWALPVPRIDPPAPPPAHLRIVAAGFVAAAPATIGFGLASGINLLPSALLSVLQLAAGLLLLRGTPRADRVARLAAGLSAPFPWLALWAVPAFAFLSTPAALCHFGVRPDPAPAFSRRLLLGALASLAVAFAALYGSLVADALAAAHLLHEPLSPLMDAASRASTYAARFASWTVPAAVAILLVLARWSAFRSTAFAAVAVLLLAATAVVGGLPVAAAAAFQGVVDRAVVLATERDVPALVFALREGDPVIRLAAARGLESAGPGARSSSAALVPALHDRDPRVRLAAAATLARLDPGAPGLVPILLGALERAEAPADEVRVAARALGWLGPAAREAVPALLRRLPDGNESAAALAEIVPTSIPGLAEALRHADPAVRRRAVNALGRIGPAARSAAPALAVALGDSDPGVRAEAVAAWGDVQQDKGMADLDRRRGDAAAAEALCRLGRRDVPAPPGNARNSARTPTVWDHLRKTAVDVDLEGTTSEILAQLADKASTCVELAPGWTEPSAPGDGPLPPFPSSFRRVRATTPRRSVLDVLSGLDVDFVLEPDRIRVLPKADARTFWSEWRPESRSPGP